MILFLLWLAILILPFIFGFLSNSEERIFNGFLLNPIDGNSYLAKMQQGFSGEWSFQLPYTAQKNQQAYIFSFYLFLGHLAQLLHISVMFMFHIVRIFAAIFMFFMMKKFVDLLEVSARYGKFFLLAIMLLGGGMGWLYMISGNLPADFWVAEAYPILSAISNPHFSLSIALILSALILSFEDYSRWWHTVAFFLIGFLLAVISPFSVLIVWIILFGQVFIKWKECRKITITNFIMTALGSLPLVLYQFIAVKNDPILNGWNAQNITPAPTLINFLFSFSPFLIGLPILYLMINRKGEIRLTSMEKTLLIWLVSVIILLYLPLNLQRRFLVAFYVPVVSLFFLFLNRYLNIQQDWKEKNKIRINTVITLLAIPSTILILLGALTAISVRNENLFYPAELVAPANWLKNTTMPGTVVLTGPRTGLLLPSLSPIKTVYGHPFETVNANQTLNQLIEFLSNENPENALSQLRIWQVDYIFYGSEERSLSSPLILESFPLVYEDKNVQIFKVSND